MALISTRGEKVLKTHTEGYDDFIKIVKGLGEKAEKKYGLAYTNEVAQILKAEVRKRVRRNEGKVKTDRRKWPVPLYRTIRVKKLSARAKAAHGHVGYDVRAKGPVRGYAQRLSWLENETKNVDGSTRRAYEATEPARAATRPHMQRIGEQGVLKKLQRDWNKHKKTRDKK